MGSEKIFMFGEPSTGGRADLTAILPALMNNNKGIDPNILAMLGNRDGNGRDGFGNDFFAILLLFILMGWGGNNNGDDFTRPENRYDRYDRYDDEPEMRRGRRRRRM